MIAVLMATAAFAEAPAPVGAPDMLPKEVIGVVGSGDQLALKIVKDQQVLTLRPGQEYRDGWILDTLDPATATLSRNGQKRTVGLNPDGALGSVSAAPSEVAVVGDSLDARRSAQQADIDAFRRANGLTGTAGFKLSDLQAFLGPERWQAFLANDARIAQLSKEKQRADALAQGDMNLVRYYDHQPVAGPDQIKVAPGQSQDDAARAVGLDSHLGYAIDTEASTANGVLTLAKCNTPASPPLCANQ